MIFFVQKHNNHTHNKYCKTVQIVSMEIILSNVIHSSVTIQHNYAKHGLPKCTR